MAKIQVVAKVIGDMDHSYFVVRHHGKAIGGAFGKSDSKEYKKTVDVPLDGANPKLEFYMLGKPMAELEFRITRTDLNCTVFLREKPGYRIPHRDDTSRDYEESKTNINIRIGTCLP